MIYINLKKYRVIKDGKEINLTPLEFKLLKLLSGNNIVTYEEMTKCIYGNVDEKYFRTANQLRICRLNKKMNLQIKPIRNKGYLLIDDVCIE